MRAQKDALGELLTGVLYAYFIAYGAYKLGGWTAVVIVFSLFALSIVAAIFFINRKIASKKLLCEQKPCKHGVDGANQKPSLCKECTAEYVELQRRLDEEKSRRYVEWVNRVRTSEYLKTMHPQEFERLVCQLYARIGFEAEITRYAGDGGVDGYLRKNGELTILQCKRVKGSVGEPVLRDLYGTMRAEGALNGLVVTTGKVSKQAREWVEGKPIAIVEIEELQGLIRDHFNENDVIPADFNSQPFESLDCPRCGSKLRSINGRRGRFWGCSAYPSCKYTRQLYKRQKR